MIYLLANRLGKQSWYDQTKNIDSIERELQKIGIIIKTREIFALTYCGKQKKITLIA